MMYLSFTTVAQTGNEMDFFFYYLKIKSEGEFPISSGTFFQS